MGRIFSKLNLEIKMSASTGLSMPTKDPTAPVQLVPKDSHNGMMISSLTNLHNQFTTDAEGDGLVQQYTQQPQQQTGGKNIKNSRYTDRDYGYILTSNDKNIDNLKITNKKPIKVSATTLTNAANFSFDTLAKFTNKNVIEFKLYDEYRQKTYKFKGIRKLIKVDKNDKNYKNNKGTYNYKNTVEFVE